MSLVPHAFFSAISHVHYDEVKGILLQYDLGKWIIAKEKTIDSHQESNGEHIHFWVEMTQKDYEAFAARVFIKRFKLRGRATKGNPRQYGKVKEIENQERMKAYTVKDGDFETNMSDEEIQKLCDKSFKKVENIDIFEKVMGNLRKVEFDNIYDGYKGRLQLEILRTHIREDVRKDLSKLAIDRYIRLFILYHSNLSEEAKLEFFNIFFL